MIDLTDKMFDAVQPGQPGYFKTREDGVTNVRRIVRDGSGTLWTSEVGSGVRLADVAGLDRIAPIECLAPVGDRCPHDGPTAVVHRAFHEQVVEKLRAELELMRGTTYCAYCGARFELDAPDMSERITAHIMTCDQHPMRAVERERDAAQARLAQLAEAGTGYSQQTMDALVRERAQLRAQLRVATAAVFGPEVDAHIGTLAAMAKAIGTQDNACTEHPIFLVQQRRRVYGFDPVDGGSVAVWLDACNDCAEIHGDEEQALEAAYQETGEVPPEYMRTGYADQWEFVQPFFSKAGAEAYIEANRHRMTDPRVYVDSGYRNREWQAIRALLAVFAKDGLDDEVLAHARRWEAKAEEYRAHAIADADEIEAAHVALDAWNWPRHNEHEEPVALRLRVAAALASVHGDHHAVLGFMRRKAAECRKHGDALRADSSQNALDAQRWDERAVVLEETVEQLDAGWHRRHA